MIGSGVNEVHKFQCRLAIARNLRQSFAAVIPKQASIMQASVQAPEPNCSEFTQISVLPNAGKSSTVAVEPGLYSKVNLALSLTTAPTKDALPA